MHPSPSPLTIPLLNKPAIVKKIIEALTAELEAYLRSAKAAHAEATHEQNKAENKYDTRGLEAGYLARGQSQQAAEVRQAIARYEALDFPAARLDGPIEIGDLVTVERDRERTVFFIGPGAGGLELEAAGETILVITPQSPIGQHLVGRKSGDKSQMKIGSSQQKFRILEVR